MNGCTAEMCANWTGQGCICEVIGIEPECGPCTAGTHWDCEATTSADDAYCCCGLVEAAL